MTDLWRNVVQLVGAACEIAGVLLMARVYIKQTQVWAITRTLISGLVRGRRARDRAETMKRLPALATADHLAAFQGLSLIALGFFLVAVPLLIEIVSTLVLCVAQLQGRD